ncbi:FecR family protein [Thalassotalea euphylliae]|uniref:FecR family protein n=1 Tax=Thalassotalea euphylliae TaxID=1655234 RepID=UPI00363BA2AD
MSNVHVMSHNQKIADKRLEQASLWIAKVDRELSNKEKDALQAWLAESEENLACFVELAKLWDKMDDLSRLADIFPKPQWQAKKRKWPVAMAASFAAVCALVMTFLLYQPASEDMVIASQKSYQTKVGESQTIQLSDASTLVLNTDSFVQVSYTKNARVLNLVRGEIHIDVAHDKERPLSVMAQGKVIQAVGTAFNVEVKDELVELIVTEGKVRIAENETQDIAVALKQLSERLPVESVAVKQGEKIDLVTDTETASAAEQVEKMDEVAIAANLSWQRGNLIFRGEALDDVLTEISRYTDIEFELANDIALSDIKVAGMFKTGDVSGLLNVLNTSFDIQHEKLANGKVRLTRI